ncbi:MAG: ATP-binding cassette domain-containing protein [Thermoanaerobaculia bacterium]
MITLDGVTYRYPGQRRPVLERFDLEVAESEMLLVAGPSGVGKSSLLRCLNGLVPHFHGGSIQGRICVDGRDPIALGPRGMGDRVGFVTQDPEAHFVAQLVEDELAFAMENHNVAPSVMRRRIEEVLDQLSIAHLRHRDVDTLSGGERQRVAIASVLTLQPAVLVLDEPTSQLDPQAADEVLTTLQKLNHDFGMTIVLSEHRLERVVPYVDRLLLMSPEAPPRLGPPAEVIAGSPLAPPLVRLAEALGWRPLPLTIKEARRHPRLAALREQLHTADSEIPRRVPISADDTRPAIVGRGLWLRYENGCEALTGLDLEVPRGSLTVLMGRNGSGKSTLLKTLVGLVRPDRGTVRLRKRSGEVLSPTRLGLEETTREVGFVPQNPSRLLFHETVDEELRFSLRTYGKPAEVAAVLCAELDLEGLGGAYPRDLSTGERQRVALAVVLAGEPEILLLDEPTRGLDLVNKTRLSEWLQTLRDRGVTILMATHDVELAAACADRVVILGGGRVVVEGPTREVMCDSLVFGSQINKLLRDPRFLTVEDVRAVLAEVPS